MTVKGNMAGASGGRCGMVSLVGRPNAGKSTLLNLMVGERLSIVTSAPQTTRNRILGMVNHPRGQIIFMDTPGIHRPLHRMNRRMMSLAVDALSSVDLVLLLVDAGTSFGGGDAFVLQLLERQKTGKVFLLLNKIDVLDKNKLLPLIDHYQKSYPFQEIIPISALTGENQELLLQKIIEFLPVGPPLYPEDQLTDQPERQLAAEIIREKLITHTREELPYVTAVEVEQFEEARAAGDAVRISAVIIVEKQSQKGIIIGKRGELLKKIGTAARLEMERFLGTKIFLQLWVKVKPGWRENDRLLDRLGLEGS